MYMSLSYAHEHKRHVTRDKYITAPPFVIPCLRGTLLIFKAVDDLLFCHEAAFPTDSVFMEIKHIMGYRHAYVFRWLQLKRLFRKSDGSAPTVTTRDPDPQQVKACSAGREEVPFAFPSPTAGLVACYLAALLLPTQAHPDRKALGHAKQESP